VVASSLLPSFLPLGAFMEEGIDSVDTGFRNCLVNNQTRKFWLKPTTQLHSQTIRY